MRKSERYQIEVLDFLRSNGSADKQALGVMLRLSESTLSRLIRKMVDAQLVEVSETEPEGPGRPAQIFQVNGSLAYAIGVELGPTTTRWAVINVAGDVLKHGEHPTKLPTTNVEFLMQLEGAVAIALDESRIPRDHISSVGVAVHGFIDRQTQTCIFCTTMPGPRNVPVGSWLEERFGYPVIISDEGNSVALVESRFGSMGDTSNFITVTHGKSIGTGIVVDHQLYTGESGMSGQLAHISVDSLGPRCVCGARGCVEVAASSQAIIDYVSESLEHNAITTIALDDDPLDIEAIVRASEKGDRLCYQALNRAGEMIGVGIGTLIKVLSIQQVVMYGVLPRMPSVFVEAVRRSAKLSVLPLIEPDIRISSLPTHAVPQGAALFALDRVFTSRAEELIRTAEKE